MLSILRALIGCWHSWNKWEFVLARVEGDNRPCLQRTCSKCGWEQTKIRYINDD